MRKLTGLSSRQLLLVATSVVAVGLAAQPALADVYVNDVQLTVNPADTVSINGNGWQGFSSYEEVYDGQLTFTIGSGSTDQNGNSIPAGTTLPVWCVDIYHDIGLGPNGGQSNPIDYMIGALNSNNDGTNGGAGTALSQNQINAMSWLIVAGDAYLPTHATPDVSGGIQLALWELEYGTTYGGTGFNYTGASSANMVKLANWYISQAWAQKGNGAFDQYVYTLENPTTQSFGAYADNLPVAPPSLVPEPGSLGLLGSALLGLAGLAGYRRRKAKASV